MKRNTIEVISDEELNNLLLKKEHPVVYCGYEPSGPVHLGHLVTINKLIDFKNAGFHVKVLLADWHAWLNHKGTLEEIDAQTKKWIKSFKSVGLDAEFVIGTSFEKNISYLEDVFRISDSVTINRALRSMQKIARDEEHATVSQMLYPLMQIEDIKALKVDVAVGGLEQRKIHMLAREILPELDYKKPICVHTPLISSLLHNGKMSSSEKNSMISVLDSDEEIKIKIRKSYCLEGIAEENPILEILKLIIFPRLNEFSITRKEEYGGNKTYKSYSDVEDDFVNKRLHPMDLKAAVSEELIKIISKIRDKYNENE
ncbi:MAG: tyrosine--tRNA ligase [Nitrospiraceae bacterium]|nr:tyrosine--tRNA ligase [Nitrospiraceae bacterium]